ncbi:MAG TPA: aminotransferase class I/II-fold pyridoxal phosphate-dependent enzyme [Lacibacter sp.]|nr:aminotransferase class I/II-fold pyridoxal phosphate-dependent enzyme [Lacibacter sp.]HMO90520.1 aminotransferase class I/II-fold pyridoxal phosphate-dependent enzyme [Lacibacter sp.]HMP86743.1 aminotransferase class I/II-fold pyridoxal phosphate-dependent enzyme [Lacibacter sp.]
MKLSHLSHTLIGSEIVKLGNQIKERIRLGEHIYNFTIGDFDSAVFPIPDALRQRIEAAYRDGFTTYPAAEGILELRQSVAQFLRRREGLDYSPAEIQIASGGRPLIYATFRALVDKGDRVVYAVPSWNNNHYVHFTDAVHVVVEARPENRFMPTAGELAPHLGGATLLCLCTPQNPTGTMFSRDELLRICELVRDENRRRTPEEKPLFLLFDQMYWTLTYGGNTHHNPVELCPELRPYTVFIDGISKAFAATGVRVGWAVGPENIIARIKAILSHVGAWAPMAEQKATAAFLQDREAVDSYLAPFKAALQFRLEQIAAGFNVLRAAGHPVDVIAPQGAIYLTVQLNLAGRRTRDGKLLATQADVTQYLLEAAQLAIVPFSAFGAGPDNPWYRLSVGTCREEDIPAFLGKLRRALEELEG